MFQLLEKKDWIALTLKIVTSILVFSFCLIIYRELGPKYNYIVTADESVGADLYRYNRFNSKLERCFINRHRTDPFYKSLERIENNESIRCIPSYEITDTDIQELVHQAIEDSRRKTEGAIKDDEKKMDYLKSNN